MRILLWHGYLLGGTGSNVYTRMLAREWSRAGHDVTVLSQEPHPERYDLGGARRAAGRRRPAAGLRPRPLRGLRRARASRTARAKSSTPGSRRTPPRSATLLPADLVFTNHVLLGGPVGAAAGAPFAVKAHGSELEYSMRGNAALSAWGAESLARRAGDVRRLRAHPRRARRGLRPHRERASRYRPASTSTSGCRSRARQRSPALLEEARRDPPNPGQRRGAPARTRATPRGSRRFLAPERADRRLLRQADRAEGRPRPDRRAGRARRPPRRRRLRPRARGARGTRRRARRRGPLHRAARAPPPPAPARARRRLRRAVDLPRGVRHGRRRGGRGRLPAARRPPLGARRGRRRPRGGISGGARATSPRSTRATPPISRSGSRELLALAGRGPRGAPGGRTRARWSSAGAGPASRAGCSSRLVTGPGGCIGGSRSRGAAARRFRKCSIDYVFPAPWVTNSAFPRSAPPRRARALRRGHRLHRCRRGGVRAARPRLARPRQPLRGRPGGGSRNAGRAHTSPAS